MNPVMIGKYLAHQCSPDEIRMVETWIAQNSENAGIFNQVKKIWDETGAVRPAYEHAQTEAAWQKIKTKINTAPKAAPRWKKLSYVFPRAVAAAVVIFTSMLIFYLVKQNQQTVAVKMVEISTQKAERRQITLADGSKVWLNAESTIKYPESFDGTTREIYLEGEAYFNVEHNAEKPFIVHTDDLETKVLGTSFNVEAYAESDDIVVSLDEGKVSLTGKKESIILQPGSKGVYSRHQHTLHKDSVMGGHNEWRNEIINFENTSLGSAVKVLERWYGIKIDVAPHLEKCRITASFKKQSATEVLEIITTTLSLEFEETNGIYHIKGGNCE